MRKKHRHVVQRQGSILETMAGDPSFVDRMESISNQHTLHLTSIVSHRDGDFSVDSVDNSLADLSSRGVASVLKALTLTLPTRRLLSPGAPFDTTAEYRLVGVLGKGGTGVVYQAHQRAVDREVAVKVLRDELADDLIARQQFLVEATTIGGLDHPNVIAIHEVGSDHHGRLFYSMKRVDGTAWSAVIDQRSAVDNLQTLLRVADAISYAHSRGLIHRDLKPENVMLGPFGEVLVADWGLAVPHPLRPIESDSVVSIGGTPAYMAPELARGDLEAIGPQTDVYLLGAVLYRILAGKPPHAGRNVIECLQAAADNLIQPTEVQGELMEIALRAMAFEPSERYESVAAFQAAAQEYLQHQESVGLVDRGKKLLREADSGSGYESFGLALSMIQEALDIWPENRRAAGLLKETRLAFARRAADQGDLDLAGSMIESAGAQASELGQEIDALRASRSARCVEANRFALLFEHSPDAVLLTRLEDGMVLEANDMLLDLIGHERDLVVGRSVLELQFWETPKHRQQFVRDVIRSRRVDNVEVHYTRPDGRRVWILLAARMMEFDGEKLVVTHARDNSARKLAELQLHRNRQRLREVHELANLGMWELNVADGSMQWGDLSLRILGVEAGPASLDEWLDWIHADDRDVLDQAIQTAITSGAAFQLDLRVRRKNGTYNRIRARGQPIIEDSRTVELFGTLIDVADRTPVRQDLFAPRLSENGPDPLAIPMAKQNPNPTLKS